MKYDVIMSMLGSSTFDSAYKNWTLAVQIMEEMLKAGDYKILLIGRYPPEHLAGKIYRLPMQSSQRFYELIKNSKALLVPSMSDASPRIIT